MSRGVRKRGEMVIIKSCNQLANLSSSVLIKPSPPDSLSFIRFFPFGVPFPFLSLILSFFLNAYVSLHHLPTHAKLFLPFRTLGF